MREHEFPSNLHTFEDVKRKPRLLRQVGVKLFEIMPKLHILPDTGDITFNYINKQRRFGPLKFQGTAILDFMTSALSLLLGSRGFLCETIGQRIDKINSKMAARGKF